MVYTPIKTNPIVFVAEDAAIKSTLARAGPTHGVQEKLKVKPITNATTGDIAITFTFIGNRFSFPNIPP